MKNIEFIPFRTGEYAIDDFVFRPGMNEVPDHIASTEPYKLLVESGSIKEPLEPATVELETESDPLTKTKKGTK